MGNYLKDKYNIKLFLDDENISFDVKRWNQTIEIK
jgi:hypothetical protein